MARINSKIQVFPLLIPSGTTAQTKPFNFTMLADYKRVKGFYIIRNSGSAYLEVSIKDGSGNAIVEPVNVTHLTVANNIEIDKRFSTETPFEANGKQLTLTVQNCATLGADENMDLVLLLDNKDLE